ncbi:MAG: hypothetical protein Q7T73_07280 [Beijerinckiaceae bacterium]|nr:hypothetical protein [Beijerinckiaceae bacterium]
MQDFVIPAWVWLNAGVLILAFVFVAGGLVSERSHDKLVGTGQRA